MHTLVMLDRNAEQHKIALSVLRPRGLWPHKGRAVRRRYFMMLARTRRHHTRVHIVRNRRSHAMAGEWWWVSVVHLERAQDAIRAVGEARGCARLVVVSIL